MRHRSVAHGAYVVAALALIGASALPAAAGRRRSVRPIQVSPATVLSVTLTPVADGAPLHSNGTAGALDLGAVSYAGAHRGDSVEIEQRAKGYTVTTKFGLTISDPNARVATASVTAYLVYPSRYVIRIDGMKLDATPRLILSHVPVGRLSVHRIAVDVPNDVAADASAVVNHPIQFAAIPE